MKAVLLQGYGDVSRLEYTDVEQPEPGPGELLVKVEGTSVNPIDYKVRRGDMKERMPLEFPAILGRDAAGQVAAGGGDRFKTGERVMGLLNHTYAEFVVAKAEELTPIPDGLNTEDAAALPLILLTGCQLIELGVKPQQGETVLVTGALGSVGRTAVFIAKQHGARVIAGVRGNQIEEAGRVGADATVALDDDAAIEQMGKVDSIADTVGGTAIASVLPQLKEGGRLGTVVGKPEAAGRRGDIHVVEVYCKPDAKRLHALALNVQQGELKIPIARVLPLADVREAQTLAENGSAGGKVVLIP